MKEKLHTLVLFGGIFVIVSFVLACVAVFWYYTIIAPKRRKSLLPAESTGAVGGA
jgi:hypothetical protein